jgi:hypothetical protein
MDLRAAATARRGECLATEYVNSTKRVSWRCAHGHVWEAPAKDVLNSKSWCPFCAGRRHDLSEMRAVARSRGGECLAQEYLGMQKKLRWRCAHGHEWSTTPATVIQGGAWCPDCSTCLGERLTRAAIEQLLGLPFPKSRPDWLTSERGTTLELDGYNPEIGIAFEHQGDQHFTELAYFAERATFQRRLSDDQRKRDLCASRGVKLIEVPQVGTKLRVGDLASWLEVILVAKGVGSVRRGITPDYRGAYETSGAAAALNNLCEIARAKGGKCLEPHYLGSKGRHLFRCAVGHEWRTPADSLVQGKWCPRCAAVAKAQKSRHLIDRVQEAARLRGGRLLSTEYRSSGDHLLWACERGHQWQAPYNSIRDGKWCPVCVRRSLDELQEVAAKRGGKVLSREYLGMQHLLEWECVHGHQWRAQPLNVVNGTWCPHCARNHPLTIDQMRSLAATRGGECLSDRYGNARQKLRWRCAQGHEWDAAPYSIKAGTWCPACSRKLRA